MARFYHPGGSLHAVPSVQHPQLGRAVRVPEAFCKQRIPIQDPDGGIVWRVVPEYRPLPEGSLVLSLPGEGYWVVAPGEHVDVPDHVSTATVKSAAPHLLTEEERAEAQPKTKRKTK